MTTRVFQLLVAWAATLLAAAVSVLVGISLAGLGLHALAAALNFGFYTVVASVSTVSYYVFGLFLLIAAVLTVLFGLGLVVELSKKEKGDSSVDVPV